MSGTVYGIYYKHRCIYVGSTLDLKCRISRHYRECYNKNQRNYKKPLYKYIREKEINFKDDCEFKVLATVYSHDEWDSDDESDLTYDELRKQLRMREQLFIDELIPRYNVVSAYVY